LRIGQGGTTFTLWKVISGTPSTVQSASGFNRATTPFLRLNFTATTVSVQVAPDAGGGVPGTWATPTGMSTPPTLDAGFDPTTVRPFFRFTASSGLASDDIRFDDFMSAEPTVIDPTLSGVDDKTYDATTDTTGGVVGLTGVAGGHDVTASATSITFADANAGAGKTVTASGISLSGADAGLYTLSTTSAVDTADITARAITITADDLEKIDGAADPDLTAQVTTGAIQGSDTASGALEREAGEDVGEYAITQGDLTYGSNYDETFVPGTFTIRNAFPEGICDAILEPLRYRIKKCYPADGHRFSRWKRKGRHLFGA
jgi:hypothetical protein